MRKLFRFIIPLMGWWLVVNGNPMSDFGSNHAECERSAQAYQSAGADAVCVWRG